MTSAAQMIEKRIREMEPGAAFVAGDFLDIASVTNANTTLSRLADTGTVVRAVRGVYAKPQRSKLLGVDVPPSPDEVARAIARSNKWIVSPSGDAALNQLGLDTQVPATYEYVSTGPYKTYRYGKFNIAMRHTASRDLIGCSPVTCLVVQALKTLGKDRATDDVAWKLAGHLGANEVAALYRETKNSTSWVFEFAKRMKEMRECWASSSCPPRNAPS